MSDRMLTTGEALRRVNSKLEHPLSYSRFWKALIEGRIPATQTEHGRWVIAECDLPKIVERMQVRWSA